MDIHKLSTYNMYSIPFFWGGTHPSNEVQCLWGAWSLCQQLRGSRWWCQPPGRCLEGNWFWWSWMMRWMIILTYQLFSVWMYEPFKKAGRKPRNWRIIFGMGWFTQSVMIVEVCTVQCIYTFISIYIYIYIDLQNIQPISVHMYPVVAVFSPCPVFRMASLPAWRVGWCTLIPPLA